MFTLIVKSTRVLFPTTSVTLTVFSIVKITSVTLTVSLSFTKVLFSLQFTVTLLVKLPTRAVLTVILNSIGPDNSLIVQVMVFLSSLTTTVTPSTSL